MPLNRILISSDGNGAPPKEEKGEAVPTRANYGHVGSLHMVWRQLIEQDRLKPEEALALVTSNVAKAYHLKRKGRVDVGMDADLLFLDENWNVDTVVARGKVMVEEREIKVRGMFETTILEGLK